MKEIKISRKRWLRGGNGLLLNGCNNTMCCLGFASRALGLTRRQILGMGMPSSPCRNEGKLLLPELVRKQGRYFIDRKVTRTLSGVNDAPGLTDAVREKKLKTLAAKAGFKFVFVP